MSLLSIKAINRGILYFSGDNNMIEIAYSIEKGILKNMPQEVEKTIIS